MLQFTNDCRLGIPEIDNEHEKLFSMVNEGYELLSLDKNLRSLSLNLLKHLKEYVQTHFAHEEAYMKRINDPELASQQQEHKDFTDRINAIDFTNLPEDQIKPTLKNLLDYLSRWLFGHIMGSDMLIGKYESPYDFTSKYMTGIAQIDEEHRQLFQMVKETNDIIQDDLLFDKYDMIITIINKLKDYTKEHFAHEEAYMEKIGYPGLKAQQESHNAFCDKLAEIRLDDLDDNQQEYLKNIITFLLNWLSQHILKMDKAIGDYEVAMAKPE